MLANLLHRYHHHRCREDAAAFANRTYSVAQLESHRPRSNGDLLSEMQHRLAGTQDPYLHVQDAACSTLAKKKKATE